MSLFPKLPLSSFHLQASLGYPKEDVDNSAVAHLPDQQAVATFLYKMIRNVLSHNVGKVTGMFLEMGEQDLQEMLRSKKELHKLLVEALTRLTDDDGLRHPTAQSAQCTMDEWCCLQQFITGTYSLAEHATSAQSQVGMVIDNQCHLDAVSCAQPLIIATHLV